MFEHVLGYFAESQVGRIIASVNLNAYGRGRLIEIFDVERCKKIFQYILQNSCVEFRLRSHHHGDLSQTNIVVEANAGDG